jgi:hypothetical protein
LPVLWSHFAKFGAINHDATLNLHFVSPTSLK